MESCWRLFALVFLIRPTALQYSQEIVIPPKVVGYNGSDVILPCQLRNPGENKITQMQWDYLDKSSSKPILVYRPPSDVSIRKTHLKGRVYLKNSSEYDGSAVIQEVVNSDGGNYTCTLTIFPSGTIKGNTQLVVQDQKPLSAGALIGIVTAVVVTLLLVAMVAYGAIVRKRKTTLNHIVPSDISGAKADTTGASGAKREEDVVYTGIEFKQPTRSGDNTLSSNEKHAEEDDITYSQVTVASQKKKKDLDTTV